VLYRYCFFSFTLECAINKVQENQVGLNMNGTRQLLVYADDVNVMQNVKQGDALSP
jgi:hypothetical protein